MIEHDVSQNRDFRPECYWREFRDDLLTKIVHVIDEKNCQLESLGAGSRIRQAFLDTHRVQSLIPKQGLKGNLYVCIEHDATASEHSRIRYLQCPESFFGCFYRPVNRPEIAIVREFNFLVNRPDPIRQSWVYLLHMRGWIDRGFVSYNMQVDRDLGWPSACPMETFDYWHETFLKGFDHIKSQVKNSLPLCNFADDDLIEKIILASKFSIIPETYPHRPDCRIMTEKTFRALQLPRPWLLFAATGCVQKLRDMGFDVFDDYVDHAYDLFDTHEKTVERQEAILAEAQRLMEHLTVTPGVLEHWQQKAQHNRNILHKWYQCYLDDHKVFLDRVFKIAAQNDTIEQV